MLFRKLTLGQLVLMVLLGMTLVGCTGAAPEAITSIAEMEQVEVKVDVETEAAVDDTGTGDLWYDPADIDNPWINICTEDAPKQGGSVVLAFTDQAMRSENWLSRSSTNEGFVFSQWVDLN